MGKIILEFDSIEESHDAQVALDGHKWKLAMWDLDQKLRSIVKYGTGISDDSRVATSEERNVADKLRDELRATLQGYSLSLND